MASLISVLVWLAVTGAVVYLSAFSVTKPGPAARWRDDPGGPRAAVIVNPTKFDNPEIVRDSIRHICARHAWAEPLWLETTVEDPGTGQARAAVEAGVDLVCPLGGDGTVRAVAAGLVGGRVPLGLLPGGTGNLMARNLGLPVDSLEEALHIALTGRDHAVDVGSINVVAPEETQDAAKDYYFLVMAGLGFDADVMAAMDEELKSKVGWAAYLVSGLQQVQGEHFAATVAFDDGEPSEVEVRSIMLGNCGKVQLGVELLPDARVDDGTLDAMLLSPDGVAGWAGIVGSFMTKTSRGNKDVAHRQFTSATIALATPQELELDGDSIGAASLVTVSVRPRALTIRLG